LFTSFSSDALIDKAMLSINLKRLYWFVTDRSWRDQYLRNRERLAKHTQARKHVATRILNKREASILNGPFKGMHYLPSYQGEFFTQKLLGYYEHELGEIIEHICSTPYRLIVDIGAAEGYYACGLAFRNPQATILCFEADQGKHNAIQEIAKLNCIDTRVNIAGFCDVTTLRQVIAQHSHRTLLFLDCEGGENSLLDLESIPGLKDCDILVETHDFIVNGITETLTQRFSNSHRVLRIPKSSPPNQLTSMAKTLGVSTDHLLLAADEMRPEGNAWLWLEKKSDSSL